MQIRARHDPGDQPKSALPAAGRRRAMEPNGSCNRQGERKKGATGRDREDTHAGAREAGGAGDEELERRARICGGGGGRHTGSGAGGEAPETGLAGARQRRSAEGLGPMGPQGTMG